MLSHQINRIKIDSIHQTVYHSLGIATETNYKIEQRPFFTTPDGHGKVEFDFIRKG